MNVPKIGGRASAAFKFWVIPSKGEAELSAFAYADKEFALYMGTETAKQMFEGQTEVVVIDVMTRESVASQMVGEEV